MNESRQQLIRTIERHVRRAYGVDLSDYSFVAAQLKAQPFSECVTIIQKNGFYIADDTDPNYDVSFGYQVSRNAEAFFLQLSMVGPFALLQRPCPNGTMAIVTPGTVASLTETHLVEIVASCGITLLDEEVLRHVLATRPLIRSEEDGPFTIYSAVIVDSERYPWDKEPRG